MGSSPQPSGFALGLWWASQVVNETTMTSILVSIPLPHHSVYNEWMPELLSIEECMVGSPHNWLVRQKVCPYVTSLYVNSASLLYFPDISLGCDIMLLWHCWSITYFWQTITVPWNLIKTRTTRTPAFWDTPTASWLPIPLHQIPS